MRPLRRSGPLAPFALLATALSCATLEGLAQLPDVEFHIDGATGATLAGVKLDGVQDARDLQPLEVLTIAEAVRRGSVPLRFDLHVGADNPGDAAYDLRLEKLEWTMLLEERETVSGVLERNIVLAPAATTDIPVPVELDLMEFFEEGASDLVQLALRLTGSEAEPTRVKLRARPTVRTPFGPMRFPSEITIVDRDV
jgi:hypothetical protein